MDQDDMAHDEMVDNMMQQMQEEMMVEITGEMQTGDNLTN